MSKKNVVVGILAHVDSGKTTLSEAMLYTQGSIRKIGRVDHGDAFLDTHSLEKQRGITIFAKQAVIKKENADIYLLDTPGHIDFSAETERTLRVLDYAVLVIDGSSKLQNHTFTLWKLILRYGIPAFIFVNKMDMAYRDKSEIIKEISLKLKNNPVDFTNTDTDSFFENIAACDEALMEKYLAGEAISDVDIMGAVKDRKIVPCYFGSALKLFGIKEFLDGLSQYTLTNSREELSGRIFKISYDEQGNRLTHLKVTGGVLKTKDIIRADEATEEKINQIRVYSGKRYEMVNEASAGMVVAVTGPAATYAGMGFGEEISDTEKLIEPVLNYRLKVKDGTDLLKVYNTIKVLNEEEPALDISWNSTLKEIEIKLMGQIQTEILKSIIKDRFGIEAEFEKGGIIYKETIKESVIGVGHYEPLRHYAEVHLLIKPIERGGGIRISSNVSTDSLDKNWQRLIATHIKEKCHCGVLTGSELTDVEIVIVAGKAHKKHTEGGDFRQATYRAIRQGLMKAESILLEPIYEFVLEVPEEYTGRAMNDLERIGAKFEPPVINEGETVITGMAPVEEMMDYPVELISYTKGKGRLMTTVCGYAPCHNEAEVIEKAGYNPLADLDNTPDSVFCANGAGYVVPYDRVEEFMHITSGYEKTDETDNIIVNKENEKRNDIDKGGNEEIKDYRLLDKELQEIFERTYGKEKKKPYNNSFPSTMEVRKNEPFNNKNISAFDKKAQDKEYKENNEYLLVDGYNVIFAWEDLSELAKTNIDGARDKLMDILCNYQGIKGCKVMVVFDAYKVLGNTGSLSKYHNISVVYTKEAQTADAYIEKFANENAKKYHITVATSDGLEQIITRGAGAFLISSRELKEEIENSLRIAKEEFAEKRSKKKVYLFDNLDDDFKEYLEEIRLGRKPTT